MFFFSCCTPFFFPFAFLLKVESKMSVVSSRADLVAEKTHAQLEQGLGGDEEKKNHTTMDTGSSSSHGLLLLPSGSHAHSRSFGHASASSSTGCGGREQRA